MLEAHLSVQFSYEFDGEEFVDAIYELVAGLEELDDIDADIIRRDVEEHVLPGAKGVSPQEIQELLIRVLEQTAIPALVRVVCNWLKSDMDRCVRLRVGDNELEVKGISREEQQELIDWFRLQASLKLDG